MLIAHVMKGNEEQYTVELHTVKEYENFVYRECPVLEGLGLKVFMTGSIG